MKKMIILMAALVFSTTASFPVTANAEPTQHDIRGITGEILWTQASSASGSIFIKAKDQPVEKMGGGTVKTGFFMVTPGNQPFDAYGYYGTIRCYDYDVDAVLRMVRKTENNDFTAVNWTPEDMADRGNPKAKDTMMVVRQKIPPQSALGTLIKDTICNQ